MYCATAPDRLVTKREVASRCGLSENHLAQVINQLAQKGYLNTQRGRNGGIALARGVDQIRVGQVFREIEGEVSSDDCFADADNSCTLHGVCRLRHALAGAARAFYAHLDDTTLDQLVCGNGELVEVLHPVACRSKAVLPVS